ncbi:discoidin domain-containing protein [Helcococcus kunzii]
MSNSNNQKFEDSSAKKVIDGNLDTYPDEYTKAADTFAVAIDMKENQSIKSFSINKRPGYPDANYGINGTMGKYEIYYSTDKENFKLAAKGEFTKKAYNLHTEGNLHNVGDTVYANFYEPIEARYILLVQKSTALGKGDEFSSAEFDLYKDEYEGPDYNIDPNDVDDDAKILSSQLKFENAVKEDIEGGKRLIINYRPHTTKSAEFKISEVFEIKDDDHYMKSYLNISTNDMKKSIIDYIEMDKFVLDETVEGKWTHPDESKVSSMWLDKFELLLGQPIYANGMFFGSEFPATDSRIQDDAIQIRYYSGKSFEKLKEDGQLQDNNVFSTWKNVIGSALGTDPKVVQISFFDYIEEISTPTDFRLNYNSWYDNMLNITDESIKKSFLGAEKGLTNNNIAPIDTYVVDDGWNNYYDGKYLSTPSERQGKEPNRTGFWEFNHKFPNELYTSGKLAKDLQSDFGLWVGPQGGYNNFSQFAQFLESKNTASVTDAYWKAIDTGDRNYLNNFTKLAVDYQERFDIDYWKWDGFALRPDNNPNNNHMVGGYKNMYFTSDMWEAWIDVFKAVRQQRKEVGEGLFINATCYVNLSPWMLQWVNTIWIQDSGDTGELGTGERHQQKIYYRDDVYYKMLNQNDLQFPLKNIYNHDPIYGVSDKSNATTEVFREYLFANALRGTAFWELYYSPSIMDDAKWKVNKDVVDFAYNNKHILKNAKMFGNSPKNGVYGYSAWNKDEGIVSFTNPLSSEQIFEFTFNDIVGVGKNIKDLDSIKILPFENTDLSNVSYGDKITINLKPHETIIYGFGLKDTKKPEVINTKIINENQIEVTFDERAIIEDIKLNGKEEKGKLLDDYRTLIINTTEKLSEMDNISLTIKAGDQFGNKDDFKLTPKYFDDRVINTFDFDNFEKTSNLRDLNYFKDKNNDNIEWFELNNQNLKVNKENDYTETTDFSVEFGINTS